jgi:hypothetical protein
MTNAYESDCNIMSDDLRPFSTTINSGITLLGGFIPRKTRTLKCKLPKGVDGPEAAIAVCRTWDNHTQVEFTSDGIFVNWERLRVEWLADDVFHREAIVELERQLDTFGEGLIALNEQGDARPRKLLIVARQDDARLKVVDLIPFRAASLGAATKEAV